jgi:predicted P-loop ATPase
MPYTFAEIEAAIATAEKMQPSRGYTDEQFEAAIGPEVATQGSRGAARGTRGTRFKIPKDIRQGDRHDIVYRFLRSQKARGASLGVALAGCMALNKEQCKPPLDEKELDAHLRRVWNEDDSPEFRERSGFECDKQGKPFPNSQANVRRALKELNVQPVFDQFAERASIVMNGVEEPFEDKTAVPLWLQVDHQFKFRPAREFFDAVLKTMAWEHPRHPVKEYLAALRWDGIPRIDEWLCAYGGADNTPFVRAVATLMLIAAVRRVHQPGCKFDEMPVLESGQGQGKSSALRALCPNEEWYSDDLPLNVDAKQVIERTAGKWIIEASELNGNRSAQAEHLKSMTSRQTDGPVRLAYARLPVSKHRQFIIVGTTNAAHGYLKDSTGNRRFWPVHIEAFDLAALRRDRDQLWAEAVVREAAGESIRLDPSLYQAAEREQQHRELHDPWYELLSNEITSDQIEAQAVWMLLGKNADQRNNRDAERVAAVMQKLGFTSKQKLWVDHEGKRVQRICWLRRGATEPLPSFVTEDGGL